MTDHRTRYRFRSVVCASLCLFVGEFMVYASQLEEDAEEEPRSSSSTTPNVPVDALLPTQEKLQKEKKITSPSPAHPALISFTNRRSNFAAGRNTGASLTGRENTQTKLQNRKTRSTSVLVESPREKSEEEGTQTNSSKSLSFSSTTNPLVKSARDGNVNDQVTVGKYFETGENGFMRYEVAARKWFTRAADSGNPAGKGNLAKMYFDGTGGQEDKIKAFALFKEAADETHIESMFLVAICYQGGYGTEQNETMAFIYYAKSSSYGHSEAMYQMSEYYRLGFEVIGTDEDMALVWLKKSVKAGNNTARKALAIRYAEGKGVKHSYYKALSHFRDAAENGSVSSQFICGEYYEHGKGVAKNIPAARDWYGRAAQSGFEGAHEAWLRCQALIQGAKKAPEMQQRNHI